MSAEPEPDRPELYLADDDDTWHARIHRLARRAHRYYVVLRGPDLARLLHERDQYAAACARLEHSHHLQRDEIQEHEKTIARLQPKLMTEEPAA